MTSLKARHDFCRSRLNGCRHFRLLVALSDALLPTLGSDECRLAHPDIGLTRSGDTSASLDRLRIEQLVSNLVANAVQHVSKGGKVVIAAVDTPGHV